MDPAIRAMLDVDRVGVLATTRIGIDRVEGATSIATTRPTS